MWPFNDLLQKCFDAVKGSIQGAMYTAPKVEVLEECEFVKHVIRSDRPGQVGASPEPAAAVGALQSVSCVVGPPPRYHASNDAALPATAAGILHPWNFASPEAAQKAEPLTGRVANQRPGLVWSGLLPAGKCHYVCVVGTAPLQRHPTVPVFAAGSGFESRKSRR